MDPLYRALSHYRMRQFRQCVDVCTEILTADGRNQAAWILKMRALTQQVSFDDIEVMESLVDGAGDQQKAMTCTARPGTSLLKSALTKQYPPGTQGRPRSGVVRLSQGSTSQNGKPTTARLLSRLGTASLPESQIFINPARLNLNEYAELPHVAKPLFEYLYYVLGDVKKALDLANLVQEKETDQTECGPYWKCAVNRCLIRLGLVRNVIQGASDWYTKASNLEGFLLMAKAYLVIDQPLAAIDIYRKGVEKFPNDVNLLLGVGRIYEGLHQPDDSILAYKNVLVSDASNTEAISCIASHFFYNGQPELALVLYRRLLQMGIHTAEMFNNIGLCCLNCQQFDLVIPCLENALMLAKENLLADVWYNLGHVALATGNLEVASLCWRLSLSLNASHTEASNNLAVIAMIQGNSEEAKALFNTAHSLDESMMEVKINLAHLAVKSEDYETAQSVSRTLGEDCGSLELAMQMDSMNI